MSSCIALALVRRRFASSSKASFGEGGKILSSLVSIGPSSGVASGVAYALESLTLDVSLGSASTSICKLECRSRIAGEEEERAALILCVGEVVRGTSFAAANAAGGETRVSGSDGEGGEEVSMRRDRIAVEGGGLPSLRIRL